MKIQSTAYKMREAENGEDAHDKLAHNKSSLPTKNTTVPEAKDNRWNQLQDGRFLGGAACSAESYGWRPKLSGLADTQQRQLRHWSGGAGAPSLLMWLTRAAQPTELPHLNKVVQHKQLRFQSGLQGGHCSRQLHCRGTLALLP